MQTTPAGEVNWIIETKGRIWEDTTIKDAAMDESCERISEQTSQPRRYARVNQIAFNSRKPTTLAAAVKRAPTQAAEPRLID